MQKARKPPSSSNSVSCPNWKPPCSLPRTSSPFFCPVGTCAADLSLLCDGTAAPCQLAALPGSAGASPSPVQALPEMEQCPSLPPSTSFDPAGSSWDSRTGQGSLPPQPFRLLKVFQCFFSASATSHRETMPCTASQPSCRASPPNPCTHIEGTECDCSMDTCVCSWGTNLSCCRAVLQPAGCSGMALVQPRGRTDFPPAHHG